MTEPKESSTSRPHLLGADSIELSKRGRPGELTFKQVVKDTYDIQLALLRGSAKEYLLSQPGIKEDIDKAQAETLLLSRIDNLRTSLSNVGEERAFATARINAQKDFETLQANPDLLNS